MTPGSRRSVLPVAVLAALMMATILPGAAAAGSPARQGGPDDRVLAAAADVPGKPRAEIAPSDPLPPTGNYIPSLDVAGRDTTALHRAGCQQNILGSRLIICVRGDPDGRTTVMLVGASHATHLFPAVNRLARDRGWRLLTAVKAGCRLNTSRSFAQTTRDRSCKAWLEALLARIRRNPPDIIITNGTSTTRTGERLPAGYLDMWRRFNRWGIQVVAVRDTPRASFDRVTCLRAHRARPGRCAISRNPTLDTVDPLVGRQDELPANVIPVDLTGALCTATRCPAVSGSYVIYRDGHHFTETYARRLAPRLAEQVP